MHIPTDKIKAFAQTLGFCDLGVTQQRAPKKYKHYLDWVNRGYHQNMWYLAEPTRRDKRGDASTLLPSYQSMIVGAISYNHNHPMQQDVKLARYGQGLDYHHIVKEKFGLLATYMTETLGLTFEHKIVVDTAPLLERDFAQQAGIGWVGKNTMIMNQTHGSYLYLGAMLTSLLLHEDAPVTMHCGTCTACIDACPTDAIEAPYLLNPAKCISYHTIENRDEDIPPAIREHLDGWIAGCDICQEVCPWNNKAVTTTMEEVQPRAHSQLSAREILAMKKPEHKKRFAKSAFSRIPLTKLQQNVKATLEKPLQVKKP